MKVSFDFDGTLSRESVQEFATSLVNENHEVWIVTSRNSDEIALKLGYHWVERQNQLLFDIADQCGILRENIVFTERIDKIYFLKDKGFLFHLDDDLCELEEILWSVDPCKPVNVDHFGWKETCLELINKNK